MPLHKIVELTTKRHASSSHGVPEPLPSLKLVVIPPPWPWISIDIHWLIGMAYLLISPAKSCSNSYYWFDCNPKTNECPLKRLHFKRKGWSSKHYFAGDMVVFVGGYVYWFIPLFLPHLAFLPDLFQDHFPLAFSKLDQEAVLQASKESKRTCDRCSSQHFKIIVH